MIISLVGMSGSGKTYWSKKLTDQGFSHICCDDLIEYKLVKELVELGYSGIKGVAQWLGQPYEQQFHKNQEKFMQSETEVMNEIFGQIKSGIFGHRVSKKSKKSKNKNVVIDTGGSVIYTGKHIMKQLKKCTTIVYLKMPQFLQEKMFKLYLDDPKPVIWKNSFKKYKGESNEQALKRCYPELLKYRVRLYKKYADIVLDVGILKNNSFTIQNFLEAIFPKHL